jgi:hypothetical protein
MFFMSRNNYHESIASDVTVIYEAVINVNALSGFFSNISGSIMIISAGSLLISTTSLPYLQVYIGFLMLNYILIEPAMG